MKPIQFCIAAIISMCSFSCSTQYTFTNSTQEEILLVCLLSKDDTRNLNISYDEIKKKNILKSSLKPGESIVYKRANTSNNIRVYYENSSLESYYKYNLIENKIVLNDKDKLEYDASGYFVEEPEVLRIKIDNRSAFYIRYVIVHSEDFPSLYYTLNPWNIIEKDSRSIVTFNGFEKGNEISSISLIGYDEYGNSKTITFQEDLDSYLVFHPSN